MKQTAVEWLENELNKLSSMGLSIGKYSSVRKNIFEQAKEMEKEQMNNFFKNGIEYGFDSYHANELAEEPTRPNFEQYYNVTFKSE